jgi:hypothetical protein
MTGYTTRAAAKALDGELASAVQRAGYVLRDHDDPAYVEVAGYVLQPVEGGTWQVYDAEAVYDESTDNADPVDELVVDRFKSARELATYLSGLEGPNTSEGDVTAPEVA